MDGRFKIIFLLAVLFLTSVPIIGILKGTTPPPSDPVLMNAPALEDDKDALPVDERSEKNLKEEMVLIPTGEFIQGTNEGGFNEGPERTLSLEAFWIDRFEVMNHHYLEFVESTRHRKPGPPSRYAKRLSQLRGSNQPVTYVSWGDAQAYCQWKGKRLPTEAEWEKAMRGIDGRLYPWGNQFDARFANLGGAGDPFEATAPVGSFPRDRSVFGVYDGAGNLMEWVMDWYEEQVYQGSSTSQASSEAADYGSYKTLRGGGYTSRGIDLRITNRSFMVPDFRDETIGFRCASSEKIQERNLVENSAERGSS